MRKIGQAAWGLTASLVILAGFASFAEASTVTLDFGTSNVNGTYLEDGYKVANARIIPSAGNCDHPN